MQIIELTTEHIPLIQSLAAEAWPHTYKDLLSAEQIEYMMNMMYSTDSLQRQMHAGSHFVAVKEGENYLGYLAYESGYNGQPQTQIHKIYLLPASQGKGVGRILIDKACEAAREHNDEKLRLNVNRDNNAVNFYKHMGFEIVCVEDNDIGCGFLMEDYVMNKKV